jgi:ATP-dependent RNA helicase RhlE
MSFTVFNFHPNIITAIQKCGYTVPTPIQQQAIPPVLEGRDLLGLAQTGTGKTAAFVLPTLQRLLDGPRKSIRALIVAPTRELAEQIHSYIEKMAHMTNLRSAVIYGGVSKKIQAAKIRSGVEIVVACPGRLLDHMNDRAINLSQVEILILDEADHMFDKGFLPDIRRILKSIPKKRQTLVFSATMPKEIRHLAEDILDNPATIQINHTQAAASITHALIPVEQKRKTELLKSIIEQKGMTTTLVFTKTKYKAKNVAQQLENSGYRATSIQGNLSQSKRQQALDGFKSGTFNILVATDIAARGIDVSGISHVINYDVPDTAEAYTHRTGRTGRAACTGEAFTFMTAGDDKMIKLIEQTLGKKIARETVAGFNIDAQDKIDDEVAKRSLPARSWNKKKSPSTSVAPKQNLHKRAKTDIFGVSPFSKR